MKRSPTCWSRSPTASLRSRIKRRWRSTFAAARNASVISRSFVPCAASSSGSRRMKHRQGSQAGSQRSWRERGGGAAHGMVDLDDAGRVALCRGAHRLGRRLLDLARRRPVRQPVARARRRPCALAHGGAAVRCRLRRSASRRSLVRRQARLCAEGARPRRARLPSGWRPVRLFRRPQGGGDRVSPPRPRDQRVHHASR